MEDSRNMRVEQMCRGTPAPANVHHSTSSTWALMLLTILKRTIAAVTQNCTIWLRRQRRNLLTRHLGHWAMSAAQDSAVPPPPPARAPSPSQPYDRTAASRVVSSPLSRLLSTPHTSHGVLPDAVFLAVQHRQGHSNPAIATGSCERCTLIV